MLSAIYLKGYKREGEGSPDDLLGLPVFLHPFTLHSSPSSFFPLLYLVLSKYLRNSPSVVRSKVVSLSMANLRVSRLFMKR